VINRNLDYDRASGEDAQYFPKRACPDVLQNTMVRTSFRDRGASGISVRAFAAVHPNRDRPAGRSSPSVESELNSHLHDIVLKCRSHHNAEQTVNGAHFAVERHPALELDKTPVPSIPFTYNR
jgi:hypothetical protein